MSDASLSRTSSQRVALAAYVFLLASFPLSLTSPGTTITMALAALCGIVLWLQSGSMPSNIALEGRLAAGCYLLLLSVDVANGGGVTNFVQTGINYLPLLILGPLALAFRRSGITAENIDRAMQLTVAIALSLSLFGLLSGDPRPGGINLNPNPYGFALLITASILLWRGIELGRAGGVCSAAAILSAIPLLLTGSKIVWACAIVTYGAALFYWVWARGRWTVAVAAVSAFLLALSAFYFTRARGAIDALLSEFAQLSQTGISQGGSLGPRVELAKAGWQAFLDRPILGYGLDGRMAAVFSHTTQGAPDISNLGHLHNDYITHLVSYGIFGGIFLTLYLMFIARQSNRSIYISYKYSGYTLAISLIIYMTAEIAFNMDPISSPLAIIVSLLISSRSKLGVE